MAASFDDDQVRAQAVDLMGQLDISATQRVTLQERLDAFLAHPEFVEARQDVGVQAVGVYRWGEGGMVVKILRGDGTLRFAGDDRVHRFEIEATSIGAQVGGSANWGVVVALGLPSKRAISGTYGGSVTTATALEETAGTFRMVHKNSGHTVYFVGIAAGLSANAAESKLVLALED